MVTFNISFRVCDCDFHGEIEATDKTQARLKALRKIVQSVEITKVEEIKKSKVKTGSTFTKNNFLK